LLHHAVKQKEQHLFAHNDFFFSGLGLGLDRRRHPAVCQHTHSSMGKDAERAGRSRKTTREGEQLVKKEL
jgi:hypothetical protein